VEIDQREVAFFGRITAAFTHEMKNVLAIIKESAGLMEDLLGLTQNTAFPHQERFVRSLAMIDAQTKRGIALSNRLNRFAHSPDEAVATVDLNEMLEQIVYLSERFARLNGVTLSLTADVGPLPVTTSPMGLQMAVFGCLECCWESMAAGGNINLSVARNGQEAMVTFICESRAEVAKDLAAWISDSEAHRVMKKIVKSLNCRIQCNPSGAAFDLILPAAG
jgi:C4-dicarboxylate-specific signal transduction histidine kinase